MSSDSANPASSSADPARPKWQPLNSRQRRVLGVLVEKAKTVPDSYPMTLNALVNGSNQKNNREPQMELKEDDVQQVLDELRAMGAVSEVQGSGRVAKYKHHLYEWLGVDKVEIAVMAELLLRGEQTLGELRGRAARMEAIPDLGTLQNVFKSLQQKNLVMELTPAGRGQVISHNLYKEREIGELKAQFVGHTGGGPVDEEPRAAAPTSSSRPSTPSSGYSSPTQSSPARSAPSSLTADMFAELRLEVAELRGEVARLRQEVRDINDKIS
jgi:uncharacterized protein YceH (UPF0502 family)